MAVPGTPHQCQFILTERPLARGQTRPGGGEGSKDARTERNKDPTLEEQRESSSNKTFAIMGEAVCNFVKWENMTFQVPAELWRFWIGQWQGKGLVCHSTGYMPTSRGEWECPPAPSPNNGSKILSPNH